jgi:hypothetical protein
MRRDRVIDELEQFVDLEHGISLDGMVLAPTISALLGHGNAEQAYESLLGIRRRNTSRDIDAALAHIGVDRPSSTAEDRLNVFAGRWAKRHELPEDQTPSTRTIRRWSKVGVRVLADHIIEMSGVEPPSLQLDLLHGGKDRFVMLISLNWMHGYQMATPHWLVVGRDDHAAGELDPSQLEQLSPGFLQPKKAVEFDVGLPVLVRVIWLGETQPSYQVRHISQPAGLITMTVMTPGGCGVVVYRDGDDIDGLGETAERLDSVNYVTVDHSETESVELTESEHL